MKAVNRLVALALLCIVLQAQNLKAAGKDNSNPPKLVVVGDSLSAGVQNFSLLETQQPYGYAAVLAKQAGWPLTLPLVPYPGVPNVLEIAGTNPLQIAPVNAPPPTPPRTDPLAVATNIAVPGLTVGSALTLRPSLTPADAEQGWATVVLGFPYLILPQPSAPTEIELAKALKPTIIIEWLGNNDALVPALVGQINALTPVDQFAKQYNQVLDELATTKAKIVTATVPDVTEIGFFTSVGQIAKSVNQTPELVAQMLGIGVNDYVRPSAQVYVQSILTGQMPGPLPTTCAAPLPDLGTSTLPCVLTAADAKTVRATINCYNLIIAVETALHGGTVVDINKLVNQIYTNGYKVNGQLLTTNFLGGLFSLDGIHPTNTGYGIIANEFIRTINAQWKTKIPPADIGAIFAADPLRGYIIPAAPADTAPLNAGLACIGY